MFLSFLWLSAAFAAEPKVESPKLCDTSIYVSEIVEDMRYSEDDFTYESFQKALDWFKKAEWKARVEGKTYDIPLELGWEFEMSYFNRLTKIEGYTLKQRALATTGAEKEKAVDEFCTFVINAFPLD